MSTSTNLQPATTIYPDNIVASNGKVSATSAGKRVMSIDTEREILEEIQDNCNKWNTIAKAYVVCIIVFGLSAVSTSVLVSVYTGEQTLMSVPAIKILACISTISLAVLTAFNLVANSANARNAWRSLNAAMMLYKAGSISIQELIEQYQKGENMVGNFSFNYGSNTDKTAIYSHDVAAASSQTTDKQKEEIKAMLEKAEAEIVEAASRKKQIEEQLEAEAKNLEAAQNEKSEVSEKEDDNTKQQQLEQIEQTIKEKNQLILDTQQQLKQATKTLTEAQQKKVSVEMAMKEQEQVNPLKN